MSKRTAELELALAQAQKERDEAGSHAETLAGLLREWLATELDSMDEEYEPWIMSFTKRVNDALITQDAEEEKEMSDTAYLGEQACLECGEFSATAKVARIEELECALVQVQDELAAFKQKQNWRNEHDPVTRLHNLCDGLRVEKEESPFGAKAWDEMIEEDARLRKELAAERERMRKVVDAVNRRDLLALGKLCDEIDAITERERAEQLRQILERTVVSLRNADDHYAADVVETELRRIQSDPLPQPVSECLEPSAVASALRNTNMSDEGITLARSLSYRANAERGRAGQCMGLLLLILPLAKGYAAEHPVGSNQEYVLEAERYLRERDAEREGVNEPDA